MKATLVTLALAGFTAQAGELLVLSGDDPLKTRINEQAGGVQVIFLGAPT